ncbi:hypothetical protein FOL46_004150, partial [Perkinsus olseni]
RMGRLFVLEARKEFAPEGFYKGPRERVPPFVLPMGTCPFDVELDAELSFLRFSIDEDIAPSSLGSPSVPATSTRIVCVRLKLRLLWFPMVDELNRIANAGPHPEDRYGPDSYDVPLPPQQPKPHFDWDID